MTKIYVVTKGEYSDYSIVGVYSNREKAEEVVERKPGGEWAGIDTFEIEEYDLDAPVTERYRKKFICYLSVESGEILKERETGETVSDAQFMVARGETEIRDDYWYTVWEPHYINKKIQAIEAMSSVSREHAQKLAVEKRQELLRSKAVNP